MQYETDSHRGEVTFAETPDPDHANSKALVVHESPATGTDLTPMKGTFELYKNGEMIASKVAANGTATFTPQGSITDLNNGVYEVKETQAAGDEYNLPAKNQPMAYVKANDDGEATFVETKKDADEKDKAIVVHESPAVGEDAANMTGSFTLEENGQAVDGDKDVPAVRGLVTFKQQDSENEIKTNKYQVQETKPANGYNKTKDPEPVKWDEIEKNGAATFKETKPAANVKDKSVYVTETGVNGKTGMNGKFELEKPDGGIVPGETEMQADKGVVEFPTKFTETELTNGKYQVKETQKADGHLLANPGHATSAI